MPLWKRWSDGGATGQAPLPAVGETVRLQAAGGDHVGVFQARVRAVGLRRLFLDVDSPALPEGPRVPLVLSFVRDEALYQFEARPVGPARTGALTVARPRVVTRVQRRQFYRLPLESPTTFRLMGPDDRVASGPVPARLVNLSGGGALLSVAKPVPAGLHLSLRVPAGKEGTPINVDAQVLDCHVASQGAARVYLVRVRFAPPPRLTDEDREEIIAFIYAQQRLLLRTRKLLRA